MPVEQCFIPVSKRLVPEPIALLPPDVQGNAQTKQK
jgi:hypothetical protein